MQNKISISINDEQERAIIEKINELKELLPEDLVTISEAEADSIPRLGDKSLAFVEKCLGAASENPAVCPPFVSLNELYTDLDAYRRLNRIKRALAQVEGPVSDSAVIAGSEAYTASLSIYSMSKDAARRGVYGAKEIHADLSARFPGKNKGTRKEE